MIKAFPKIFAIGTDYIEGIFDNDVEVTEKVDGSQFAFGKLDGELLMRSKGRQVFLEKNDSLFAQAVNYVVSIEDKIPDNTYFYCEYLQGPSHNSLSYERTPKNHLALFGVCDPTEKFISQHGELEKYADMLDIDVVPLIFIGKIDSADQIFAMIGEESYLGKANMEGVVVKNYEKPFLLGGQPIPVMTGKYVSEEFKELHNTGWKAKHTAKGKFEAFKESFKTEARWDKSIQHLRDNGDLSNSPKDIGPLIKAVQEDIRDEEKENIKTFLYNEFSKEIFRFSTRGFPEYYKKMLVDNNFNKK